MDLLKLGALENNRHLKFEHKDIHERWDVEIVDFIRTSPVTFEEPPIPKSTGKAFPTWQSGRISGKLPILRIRRSEDGTVTVGLGKVQGSLAGSGEGALLRKEGTSYRLLGVNDWIS